MSYEHQLLAQKNENVKSEKILFYPKNGRRKVSHDETNENMEKDKIIDNGNVISLYKCHFNCSGELL